METPQINKPIVHLVIADRPAAKMEIDRFGHEGGSDPQPRSVCHLRSRLHRGRPLQASGQPLVHVREA